MPTVKRCSKCKTYKTLENFWKNPRYRDGFMGQCKSCRNEAKRQRRLDPLVREEENSRRRETRGSTRWEQIKSKYGLTRDDYNRILVSQGGLCRLCSQEMKYPHIDHCHITGKVRGILCSKCNTGLGKFNDSEELLGKAIEYLREARE